MNQDAIISFTLVLNILDKRHDAKRSEWRFVFSKIFMPMKPDVVEPTPEILCQ